MRKRTRAREFTLQVLYQIDITMTDARACLDDFWKNRQGETEDSVKQFAEELVFGVESHKAQIDMLIGEAAENWELSRMAVVDKNILRMATYELLYRQDIPPKVSINEAIEIAKRYGNEESGKFVNGILDRINKSRRPDAEKG